MVKYFLFLFLFITFSVSAQKQKMLLMDERVQLESTDAVNDMYNFKFDKAEKQFLGLKQKYPNHPLPYFLMGLSNWWKVMPDVENEKYDDIILAYMDTTITMAKRLDDDNSEGAFFLSASYGFKARLYGERGKYSKATFAGKDALNYLEDFRENADLGPEFLFGQALFNYYEVWIKENYPLLRPILTFFPNGNKALGIKQLKEVSYNAFYTRTEAQYFLMRIYYLEEEDYNKALPLSRYLSTTFPDNAYFSRLYAMLSFVTGQRSECEAASTDILEKYYKKYPGYEEKSARYAAYFLGHIYRYSYKDNDKAKELLKRMVQFSIKTGETDSRYYIYAIANLAQIAHEENDVALAQKYYKDILKNADKKEDGQKELYEEAKAYLSKKNKKSKG